MSQPHPESAVDGRDASPNTLLNAAIGAVVTIVFSFTMFSPIVGGAVAGYLEKRDGLRVGAISGGVAAIPLLLFGLLAVFFFGIFAARMALFPLLVVFVMVPFVLLFTVGLSALGGILGVYLSEEL